VHPRQNPGYTYELISEQRLIIALLRDHNLGLILLDPVKCTAPILRDCDLPLTVGL